MLMKSMYVYYKLLLHKMVFYALKSQMLKRIY